MLVLVLMLMLVLLVLVLVLVLVQQQQQQQQLVLLLAALRRRRCCSLTWIEGSVRRCVAVQSDGSSLGTPSLTASYRCRVVKAGALWR